MEAAAGVAPLTVAGVVAAAAVGVVPAPVVGAVVGTAAVVGALVGAAAGAVVGGAAVGEAGVPPHALRIGPSASRADPEKKPPRMRRRVDRIAAMTFTSLLVPSCIRRLALYRSRRAGSSEKWPSSGRKTVVTNDRYNLLMLTPIEFRHHVRDALNHLYDQAYLETHPLRTILNVGASGEARGTALQRRLLEAIQELRPSLEVPYSSLAWRRYRYLYLRYAQAVALPEISNDLGISLRQARRYSFDALNAITALLWDRYVGNESAPEAPLVSESAGARVASEVVQVEARAHEAPISAGELLVGVAATVLPLAERRGVTLAVAFSEGAPTIVVDRAVLRQALLNLLTLALEIGARTLDLEIVSDGDDTTVQILLRADVGAEAEAAARRLAKDERWYIAHHLLQAQHGDLAVQTGSDRASSKHAPVTISLRLRSAPRTRVLVIEDNDDVVNLYRRYLIDSPYQLLASTEGMGAVALAIAERPAVVVLDVMMPTQDGWEVLQKLKSEPRTSAIPVLVCSILKERELALALGAADLLVKPVSRLDFLQALARCQPLV